MTIIAKLTPEREAEIRDAVARRWLPKHQCDGEDLLAEIDRLRADLRERGKYSYDVMVGKLAEARLVEERLRVEVERLKYAGQVERNATLVAYLAIAKARIDELDGK
jgi:hypothetical protein